MSKLDANQERIAELIVQSLLKLFRVHCQAVRCILMSLPKILSTRIYGTSTTIAHQNVTHSALRSPGHLALGLQNFVINLDTKSFEHFSVPRSHSIQSDTAGSMNIAAALFADREDSSFSSSPFEGELCPFVDEPTVPISNEVYYADITASSDSVLTTIDDSDWQATMISLLESQLTSNS